MVTKFQRGIKIEHACDGSPYLIDEYEKGVKFRYIILNKKDMKNLAKQMKELGF